MFFLNIKFLSFFLLIVLTPLQARAKPSQIAPDNPIEILSDHATYEQRTGLATYEGNVEMTQGDNHLRADKLSIHNIEQKDQTSTMMKAIGTPAIFMGRTEASIYPVQGSAKIIYYYPEKHLLVLEGQATLTHQQDKFKGPHLSYQLDTQIIQATKINNQRPTITLQPRGRKKHE